MENAIEFIGVGIFGVFLILIFSVFTGFEPVIRWLIRIDTQIDDQVLIKRGLLAWQSTELVGKAYLLAALFFQIMVVTPDLEWRNAAWDITETRAKLHDEMRDRTEVAKSELNNLKIRSELLEIRKILIAADQADSELQLSQIRDASSQLADQITTLEKNIIENEKVLSDPEEMDRFKQMVDYTLRHANPHSNPYGRSITAALAIWGTLMVLLARHIEFYKHADSKLISLRTKPVQNRLTSILPKFKVPASRT